MSWWEWLAVAFGQMVDILWKSIQKAPVPVLVKAQEKSHEAQVDDAVKAAREKKFGKKSG